MSGQTVIVVQNNPVVVTVATRAPVELTPQLAPELVEQPAIRQNVTVPQAQRAVAQVNVPGIQGAPGRDGDKTFHFTQSVPSTDWVIVHNLGKFPAIAVVDSNGELVVGTPNYLSNNELTITFAAPFSGDAYLN